MKKRNVSCLFAVLLAISTACTPLSVHATTPLTASNFNAARYSKDYQDVSAVFGNDAASLWAHYVNFGSKENRKAYATNGDIGYLPGQSATQTPVLDINSFNYQGYADKYPDLKAAFGYNQALLYNHYMTIGYKEGRSVPEATAKTVQSTVATPQASPAVFANVVPNTISILGDSISTFNGFNRAGYYIYYPKDNVTDAAQMWWAQAAAMRGLSILSNCSWSGSSVVGDAVKSTSSAGCSWRRVTDIAVNGMAPSIILIMMGTNDYNFNHKLGNHNVGETGGSSWEFTTAYDLMLTRLKVSYPNTRIICLTVPPVWTSQGQVANDAGLSISSYNAKIAAIATAHGLQVIDINGVFHGGDFIDGVHPNATGMREIAAAVAAGL